MQHYESCEAIFHAIARPRLFTVELFHELMQRGAKLSRNLVQMLYYMRDAMWRRMLNKHADGETIKWGGGIKDSAFVAVLARAVELVSCSGVVSLKQAFDSRSFSR